MTRSSRPHDPLRIEAVRTAVGLCRLMREACAVIAGSKGLCFANDAYRALVDPSGRWTDGTRLPGPAEGVFSARIAAVMAGDGSVREEMSAEDRTRIDLPPIESEMLAVTGEDDRTVAVLHRLLPLAPDAGNAESALHEMNERLRLVIEASGFATWEWDIPSGSIEWSDDHYRLLGHEVGAVTPSYEAWLDSVHPEDRAGTVAALEGARTARTLYTSAFRIVRPDGAVLWCAARGRFLYDAAGAPRRMIGMMEDVTADHLARTELEASEERFRMIVEGALTYAIFTTDAEGVIVSWPPGAEAVFGWSEAEAVGREADFLFTPEDRENGAPQAEFEEARKTGQAPDVRWHLRKGGGRVFIDGVVRCLRGPDGELHGFLKIGQDVTRRRHDELALRESEERFRLLATSVPHLVFRSTSQGYRTWASPQWAHYTGMTEAESRGLAWLEALHPDDRAEAARLWQTAEADGAYYGEHRIRRQDGVYRWHQTRAVPLRDASAVINEWVGSAADVHDLRALQARQGVLVAELQHRTRNLLAVVRAVAGQTIESAETLGSFRSAFNDRLGALSRVQGLIAQSTSAAVTIEGLLRMELAAVGPNWEQIGLEGPDVRLREETLQTLALALHELCTNALKYGALSTPEGRLRVVWSFAPEPSTGSVSLLIDWRERLPAAHEVPSAPPGSGYGRQLIEEALPYQLGARTRFTLNADGLHCVIDLPLGPN